MTSKSMTYVIKNGNVELMHDRASCAIKIPAPMTIVALNVLIVKSIEIIQVHNNGIIFFFYKQN